MSIFERFAASFPLVSDEGERWGREGPLIAELARSAGERKGRVLDLACGSGFHARHLAMEGFAVTGVDLSAAAMETGRSLSGGEKVNWVEGDITQPVDGEYDLVLLVGNTLSLFEEHVQVEKTMDTASRALVPRGVLLVHVIDFDYLRNHPVRIEREGSLDDKPVTFEKRVDADDKGAVITIAVTMQTDAGLLASGSAGARLKAGPHTDRATQRLHEWEVPLLRDMASRLRLELREEFGCLDRTARMPGRTKDVVLVFERQEDLDHGQRE